MKRLSNQGRKNCTLNMLRSTRSGGAGSSAKVHVGKVAPEKNILKENISRQLKQTVSTRTVASQQATKCVRPVPVSLDGKKRVVGMTNEVEYNGSGSSSDEDQDELEEEVRPFQIGNRSWGQNSKEDEEENEDDSREDSPGAKGFFKGRQGNENKEGGYYNEYNDQLVETTCGLTTRVPEPADAGGDKWAGDITSEKCLMVEVGNLFRRKKFFGGDGELESDSQVAHFFYDKLKVAEDDRKRWWREVQWKIRKKIDSKRSSCASAIKIRFMRKYQYRVGVLVFGMVT